VMWVGEGVGTGYKGWGRKVRDDDGGRARETEVWV